MQGKEHPEVRSEYKIIYNMSRHDIKTILQVSQDISFVFVMVMGELIITK